MTDTTTAQIQSHAPSSATVSKAHVTAADYANMYAESVGDPDAFWAREAQRIDWI